MEDLWMLTKLVQERKAAEGAGAAAAAAQAGHRQAQRLARPVSGSDAAVPLPPKNDGGPQCEASAGAGKQQDPAESLQGSLLFELD